VQPPTVAEKNHPPHTVAFGCTCGRAARSVQPRTAAEKYRPPRRVAFGCTCGRAARSVQPHTAAEKTTRYAKSLSAAPAVGLHALCSRTQPQKKTTRLAESLPAAPVVQPYSLAPHTSAKVITAYSHKRSIRAHPQRK